MKKYTKLSLMVLLVVTMFFATYLSPALANQPIKLIVNKQEIKQEISPVVINGRTFFSVRFIGVTLGIDNKYIYWDAKNQTVTLLKGDKAIQVKIGDKRIFVNGKVTNMDVVPEVIDGRIMLPVAYIAEALGYNVSWDGNTQTVNIVEVDISSTPNNNNNIDNIIVTPTQSNTPSTTNNYLEQRKAQVLSELNELKTKLENVKNNKNVQVLKKQVDGSYQYEYQADQDAVDRAQRLYDSKYQLYQSLK